MLEAQPETKQQRPVTERRILMRHFYIRLVLGIVFAVCLLFSIATMNLSFALLYLALAAVFLSSAYSLWKKGKDEER